MATLDIINNALYPNSTEDTVRWDVYPGTYNTYEDVKHLLEEFSNLVNTIYNTRKNKIKDFVEKYNVIVDPDFKISDRLLLRHFLIETVGEINADWIKNDKPYRIDFGINMIEYFSNEDDAYFRKNNFHNNDESLNEEKLTERLEYLENFVKKYTGKKFKPTTRYLEIDLPVIYL